VNQDCPGVMVIFDAGVSQSGLSLRLGVYDKGITLSDRSSLVQGMSWNQGSQ
jgi:hypothetical protein